MNENPFTREVNSFVEWVDEDSEGSFREELSKILKTVAEMVEKESSNHEDAVLLIRELARSVLLYD